MYISRNMFATSPPPLAGRRVFVTGVAQGIGTRAVARLVDDRPMNVAPLEAGISALEQGIARDEHAPLTTPQPEPAR